MGTNYVLFVLVIIVYIFSSNGEPEQYVPNFIKDKYNWAQSNVESVGESVGNLLGLGGTSAPSSKTSTKTKTSSVKTQGQGSEGSHVSSFANLGSGYKGGCKTAPQPPMNAGLKCSQYSGCRANCIDKYIFPNGETQLYITCVQGEWQVQGTEWDIIPSCEPICQPACLNNGICISPNKCHCPENYSGPQCQVESKPCLNYPPIPINSRRSCSSTSCTVSCMKGHQFNDGSSVANMICKGGSWVPTKPEWVTIPDCQATCSPPCQNGGNCLSFNVCQCPQNFKGPQCQYSASQCNARKLNFNGAYKCSGHGDIFSCVLSCPTGIKFEYQPASVYTCNYSTGKFLPEPIPQCVFGTDMEVIPLGGSSHTTVHGGGEGGFSHGGFSHGGFSGGIHIGGGGGHISGGFEYEVDPTINKTFYTNLAHNFLNGSNIRFPTGNIFENFEDWDVSASKKPRTGSCFTWGGSHYKTFDGKIFSFNSPCSFTLLRDAADNTFSVVVKNSHVCNVHPENCHKIIKIYQQDKEYTLKHSGHGYPVFSTGKKILPIPGRVPGIRIEMSAHYYLVLLDFVGVAIKWDGKQFIQAEVKENLWNRTSGLCGKLDGNPNNDLLTKEGIKPKSVVTLALSWQVDLLGDVCKDTPTEDSSCKETGVKDGENLGPKAVKFCEKLLLDKRFQPCYSIMDINALLTSCEADYCTCKSNHEKCACESLNVFVRQCIQNGVTTLTNWRDQDTCPMQCSGDRVYMPCGPVGGQQVCGAPSEETEDNLPCEEGCYCPAGTALHESKCISKDECPCLYRGKYYSPHSTIPNDCNTCTCEQGKWICTQVTCGARCSALGDPHYITFDGKRYDFMGQCSYVLLKHDNVTVEAENVACAGSISQAMNFPISVSSGLPSCTKTVTVKYMGQAIKLKQNHEIVVNGQEVTKIPLNVAGAKIRAISSIFVVVELPNGAEIWWDGLTRAYIDVPASFVGKTQGLCGTFNSNQKDDFLTPFGDVEQSVIPFANKWKTSEKCNDIPEELKSHPCELNIHNKATAEEHCSTIKSTLFTDCHSEVDPDAFYHDCMYDMCSCEAKISQCLCPIVASYASECAAKGIKIDWRNSVRECGVHCTGGQKYQICGNSCTRSCHDIATNSDCRQQCVEGCNCLEGEALDDHGECIPIGQCGCQYEGLEFLAGYKEVRPASKSPELCTCVNAEWNCRPATPEEIFEYPKASDLKSKCSAVDNKEFTTCESVEPVTCKNMHSQELLSTAICHAGCQCKEGYVLDTFTKICVKPTECSCHHGGRSYNENAVVQDDCNTCTCIHAKWECTDKPCPSECSAWGDSHYKTFDGKLYDYQGECDYILAKGVLSKELSFDVSIQNVPCSTLGVSCSKSVTVKVGTSPNQESVTLTREKNIPEHAMLKHLLLRQIGKYVIVEAPELGFTVRWDKGTRVYVKLDTQWKNKVKGLCGNYNDNEMDDFQTPSGGMTEVSTQLFGDSWRLQPYCPESVEITDTCAQRPDRKVWALKKCGILKSPVFASCHAEVPIESYLDKCIFDTCACDQGGDCECLCTALAAYAQECSNKGVHIKWRTPDLCPMQCDEHCSNYSPCISTCPVETCDNTLVQGTLTKTCGEQICVEGCQVKKCQPGFIYLNSSYLECVPQNICKPLCIEIAGVKYYEGDLIEEDACHSCYCSRGKKSCKGQPCVTQLPPIVTVPETEKVKCVDGWTLWINQDKASTSTKTPSKGKAQDIEPLPNSLIMNKLKGSHCDVKNIIAIECRAVVTHQSPKSTGLNVECSLERGLICRSNKGGKLCPDFEIRVKCQCKVESVTPKPPSAPCDPVIPLQQHPHDCQLFLQCAPGLNGNELVEKSCGPGTWYHPVYMVCDFPSNVLLVRPECEFIETGEGRTRAPPTQKPTEDSIGHIVEPPPVDCSPEEEYSNCAVECQRLCVHYLYVVKSKGVCQNNQKCAEGCVSASKEMSCPAGMFWANAHTCVSKRDCMCITDTGRPVKPGEIIYESTCKVCQCIDNFYTCDESSCHKPTTPTYIEVTPFTFEGGIIVINTVTPPAECSENSFINLIDGEIPLGDDAFSASSTLNKEFAPKYGRLKPIGMKDSDKSWSPKISDKQQYLQINLGKQVPIYGTIIKGDSFNDHYVTSYKILYTSDGHTFSYATDQFKKPKTFRGPLDGASTVKQIFDIPFEAQIIKVQPETWHKEIALNVELIGCDKHLTTEPTTTALPTFCADPMGLGDGTMADQQITVSSETKPQHTKQHLKIKDQFGWKPITNSPSEWVQFDFLEPRNITGFVTQGGPDGWVTSFNVKYSTNGKDWNPILDDDWKEHLFLGNFDENTPEVVEFAVPIQTQLLKIIPVQWHQNIQMRVEPHGCFKPYPQMKYTTTEYPTSACISCPGVPSVEMELGACRCKEGLWWDGENCVSHLKCPCIVGHIPYAVGTVFEKEDCSQCICKLGGISHCTPKVCSTCEKGLKSVVTSTCGCMCKPCDEGQTLCPTSNICINTTAWCNGVKDCPDDETGCDITLPPIKITLKPTLPPTTKQPPVKCPIASCPPDYDVVFVKQLASSKVNIKTMFSFKGPHQKKPSGNLKSKPSISKTSVKGGSKGGTKGGTKGGSGVKTGGSMQLPQIAPEKLSKEEECEKFQCVPKIPLIPPIPGKDECAAATCPAGYVPEYEVQHSKDKTELCPKYTCNPVVQDDSICKVTGRTFNTFDSTEFKYDICNHVLARPFITNDWEILLKKNCTKVCLRDLIIHHGEHTIVIHPNFAVEYDNYKYTVEQAKLIGTRLHLFDITAIGEKIVFASNKYGFWVIWDSQGNVVIGISQKLLGEIDGLCGYFNNRAKDDKRKPDGLPAKTTVEFGDSWGLEDQPAICEAKTCPLHIQNKAWQMCNLVKEKEFAACSKNVDLDAFVSRCLETICTCLQTAADNSEAQEQCRCTGLQNFVVECMVTDSAIELNDWRMIHDCPAVCETPLVHHDCYKRSCEPTCSSLSDPHACPTLDNVCFPGCYCPPGYVRKGKDCILPTSCGDCECNVLPHLKYETYDQKNFTIDGNCVYVMSRDIVENKNQDHKFQVLITNSPCEDKPTRMCIGKVTILFKGHKIHVMRDWANKKLKLIVDSELVTDLNEIKNWVIVKEEMKHFKIFLTGVQVKVSVYYPSLGVAVKAPSLKYGSKLEGLCGDCDGSLDDDLRMSDGVVTKDLNEFGTSWLYEGLPGGQDKAKCGNKEELHCKEVPVEEDPCIQLEDVMKYGQCHPLLDPGMFIEWCKQDICNGHPELSCQSIESYSIECGQLGFCVDWRTNLCPAKPCSFDQQYKACAPKCPQTCEALKDKEKICNNPPVEGCFCPEGKVMLNGTCVVEDRCEACDDEGHHSGDKWQKDVCTNCTCEGTSVKCETQNCPSFETICQEGYNALKVSSNKDCCDRFVCVPAPTSSTTCEPPQQMHCGAGQIMKLITGANGCQAFVCKCKPIEECEFVNITATPTPPGIVRDIDSSGCCPVVIETCKIDLCPKPEACPQFYSPEKQPVAPGQCCSTYMCVAPKERCIVELQYTAGENGGERPRNEFEKQHVLKKGNETWQDGPCRECQCSISQVGDYYSSCSIAECPVLKDSVDHRDYWLEPKPIVGQCCPNIEKTACKHNGKVYKVGEKWPVEGDYCTTIECTKNELGIQKYTQVATCDTKCDLGWEYVPASEVSKQCCGSCKAVACVTDGIVHKIGDEWSSPDHCINYFCLSVNGSLQVQSLVVTCKELSEELLNDYVVETSPMEGECCSSHKVVACKVGSNKYMVGESWPSPDGDKCKTVLCVENSLGEITRQESIETCHKNCSKGWDYKESNSKCCGDCVQIACVVDDELLEPGTNWTSVDGCTTFFCEQIGNQFTIVSAQESCPNTDDCPVENIYDVGCCKHCNISSQPQTSCGVEELKPLETIGLVSASRLPHGTCTNKQGIRGFTQCNGFCPSSTKYNSKSGKHESLCDCCQAEKYTPLLVQLECSDGYKFKQQVSVPSACACNKACPKSGLKVAGRNLG